MFFHDVAKFVLEVAFVSPQQYCMFKQRARFIIAAYEDTTFDWDYLTTIVLREQLHNVQKGKPTKPIIAPWVAVLCPIPLTDTRCKARRNERSHLEHRQESQYHHRSGKSQHSNKNKRATPTDIPRKNPNTDLNHHPGYRYDQN